MKRSLLLRRTASLLLIGAMTLAFSPPALAAQNNCNATYSSGGLSGNHQKPCVFFYLNGGAYGHARGYWTGGSLDQYDLSVQLYRSTDGGGTFSRVESNVCGTTDIPTSSPGFPCATATFNNTVIGDIYKTRVLTTIFKTNGQVVTSNWTWTAEYLDPYCC